MGQRRTRVVQGTRDVDRAAGSVDGRRAECRDSEGAAKVDGTTRVSSQGPRARPRAIPERDRPTVGRVKRPLIRPGCTVVAEHQGSGVGRYRGPQCVRDRVVRIVSKVQITSSHIDRARVVKGHRISARPVAVYIIGTRNGIDRGRVVQRMARRRGRNLDIAIRQSDRSRAEGGGRPISIKVKIGVADGEIGICRIQRERPCGSGCARQRYGVSASRC